MEKDAKKKRIFINTYITFHVLLVINRYLLRPTCVECWPHGSKWNRLVPYAPYSVGRTLKTRSYSTVGSVL